MIHDPDHVAHIAAVILSARPEPELHHIKAAVSSAKAVLDEAHRQAAEDEATAVEAVNQPDEKATDNTSVKTEETGA